MISNKVAPEPEGLDLQLKPLGDRKGPPQGVSMATLLRFAQKAEAMLGPSATSEQVVARIIKPETLPARSAYLRLLGPGEVGAPGFFVSHCWGSKFLDTVGTLKEHLQLEDEEDEEASRIFVWMDLFCVNQHALGGQFTNVDALLDNVNDTVAAVHTMLLCIDEHAVALSRLWVLYEIWASGVVMGGSPQLQLLCHHVGEHALHEAHRGINVAKAQVSYGADKEAILRRIQFACPGGADGMRHAIKQAMVDSAIRQGEVAMAWKDDDPLALAEHLTRSAWLLKALGLFSEAQPLCLRVLEIREKVMGPTHPETASSLNNLAVVMKVQGKYEEAKILYEQALRIKERALGPNHADTATALSNLAGLMHHMGDYNKSLELDKRALAIREAVLGVDHPATIASRNYVARSIKDMQRMYELGATGNNAPAANPPPQPLFNLQDFLTGDSTKRLNTGDKRFAWAKMLEALNNARTYMRGGASRPATSQRPLTSQSVRSGRSARSSRALGSNA